MNSFIPKDVEDYCEKHSSIETEIFRELTRETYAKTEVPQMQVGHLEGNFLKLIVKLVRAKRILEIGTFTGYSALAMSEGLPPDGELITCDRDPVSTDIARKYWSKSEAGKKIQLKLGDALETLQTLKGPFDLVFIDADKENLIRYWELVLPMIRQGGVVLVDNVLWCGQVLNPQDDTTRAIVRFNEYVKKDTRVEHVMLTIRDGITLAVRI